MDVPPVGFVTAPKAECTTHALGGPTHDNRSHSTLVDKECDVRDRTEHGYFVVPLSTSAHACATPEFSSGLRGPAALADVDPLFQEQFTAAAGVLPPLGAYPKALRTLKLEFSRRFKMGTRRAISMVAE
jgi:hypothetical protein